MKCLSLLEFAARQRRESLAAGAPRESFRPGSLAFVLAVLAVFPRPAHAIKIEKLVLPAGRVVEAVAGQALARFRSDAGRAERAAAAAAIGARVLRELAGTGWTQVLLPPGMRIAPGLALLKAQPAVLGVEPNYVFRALKVPNDPQVSTQYHLAKINAFSAWEYGVGTSSPVTVAVMDTGIQATHPDLQSKLAGLPHQFCDPGVDRPFDPTLDLDPGSCAAEAGGTPIMACHHGTRVSGVAAAVTNNGIGVAGISWGAKLLSLRIFRTADCNPDCSDATGNGCGTDTAAIINAMNYAADTLQNSAAAGHVVLNMSIGAAVPCPAALQAAADNANAKGVVLVAAAGNDGMDVQTPGNCGNVIPVGATDAADSVASFSSRGPALAANGVVAPGVNIVTTDINGGVTGSASGTSFASPLVAGLSALILDSKPNKTPSEVKQILRASADNIGAASLGRDSGGQPLGNSSGAGRVNAFRAMRLAITGTLANFEGDQKAIAFPNPFRTSETGSVSFSVPTSLQGAQTKIKVYTVSGELVRELAGLTWDGKNMDAKPVASGTYIFVVSTDKGSTRGRVAVIR